MRGQHMVVFGIALVWAVGWPAAAEARVGFKGWRFGMTPAEVQQVKACAPYTPVKVTGGLECKNFRFLGAKRNISFVFRDDKLIKIQIWVYQGKDDGEVVDVLPRLVKHLTKRYGKVECKELPRLPRLPKRLLGKYLWNLKSRAKPTAKLQFKPAKDPKAFFTFSSLIYNQQHGYFLFMYLQPPR